MLGSRRPWAAGAAGDAKTALLTQNLDTLTQMSCNPAYRGPWRKGTVVSGD